MLNKFYLLISYLHSQNSLTRFAPDNLLYKTTQPYWLLQLATDENVNVFVNRELTWKVIDHHISVFETKSDENDQSIYHYTAKLLSENAFYIYRLRVFFNKFDQSVGISWYRKAHNEADDLYVSMQMDAIENKLVTHFAMEQIQELIGFIRGEQTARINSAREKYESLHCEYEELIDSQTEETPFEHAQASNLIEQMANQLNLLEKLGDALYMKKQFYVQKLKNLMEAIPVAQNSLALDSTKYTAVTKTETLSTEQEISFFEIDRPVIATRLYHSDTIDSTTLDHIIEQITQQQSNLPPALVSVPNSADKILNESYLDAIAALQLLHQRCCEEYLMIIDGNAVMISLKKIKQYRQIVDDLTEKHDALIRKYLQTLFIFAEETNDMLVRLQACSSAIELLPVNNINYLLRKNKSKFLEIILKHKKFEDTELFNVCKELFTTSQNSVGCLEILLSSVNNLDRIFLNKDDKQVLLISYLFRLPLPHQMRLACVHNVLVLTSPGFYKKLYRALNESKALLLYDIRVITTDIENERRAEELYICSSEQKHQMRRTAEWCKKIPTSIKLALERFTSQSDSSLLKEWTLLSEIDVEIKNTLDVLSLTDPKFVEELKRSSSAQMRRFQTIFIEDEANIVNYLNSTSEESLKNDFAQMIEYYHLLNNYLRYCLPISSETLTEFDRDELRKYYFAQLQLIGMKNDPYECLRQAMFLIKQATERMAVCVSSHVKAVQDLEKQAALGGAVDGKMVQNVIDTFDALDDLVSKLSPSITDESGHHKRIGR